VTRKAANRVRPLFERNSCTSFAVPTLCSVRISDLYEDGRFCCCLPDPKLRAALEACVPPSVAVELIPGNHDRREHLSDLSSSGSSAGRVRLPGCPGKAAFASLEECGWLVIGCDSLVEGSGHGELGAAQLSWLRETLDAHPAAPVVLFMHHPPLPHLELGWAPGFTKQAGLLFSDADRLALESLFQGRAGQQVKAICVGHVHAEFDVPLAGVPVLGTPSSWVQHNIDPITAKEPADRVAYEDIPPGWRLIRLTGSTVEDGRVDSAVVRVGETTARL
jgi:3',5'-cyclic AMP phosphodiesterase CpdA